MTFSKKEFWEALTNPPLPLDIPKNPVPGQMWISSETFDQYVYTGKKWVKMA